MVGSEVGRIVDSGSEVSTGVWLQEYESDRAIIYEIDADLRIVRCNQSWDRFALENASPKAIRSRVAGVSVMEVVPVALKDFYLRVYENVRAHKRNWWHVFECSSPARQRHFQMRVLPHGTGFLTVNTLIREAPHRESKTLPMAEYLDADGIAAMCAHCRRARNRARPGVWDWIATLLIAEEALIQYELCPFCAAYHGVARHSKNDAVPRG